MVYDSLGAEPVEYKVGDEEGAFAFFQKNQAGGTLRVEILKDGKPVASRETSEEFGAIMSFGLPRPRRLWGSRRAESRSRYTQVSSQNGRSPNKCLINDRF